MKKLSILIGIDNYSHHKNNYGCKNDVDLFTQLLREQNHEIITLINEDATKGKILESLEIVNELHDQDFINIYFAGSGSFLVTPEGKINEIICPFDFDNYENYISFDKITYLFEALQKEIRVQFIFDCAFFSYLDYLRNHSSQIINNRHIPSPFDIGNIYINLRDFNHDVFHINNNPVHELKRISDNPKIIHSLWKASKYFDKSYEINLEGKTHGIFSYFLRQAPVEIENRDELFKEVKHTMANYEKTWHIYPIQEPELLTSSEDMLYNTYMWNGPIHP